MADDDLTESIVRQHLRDQPGDLYCARCLARVLNLDPSATEAAVVALSERGAPVSAGVRVGRHALARSPLVEAGARGPGPGKTPPCSAPSRTGSHPPPPRHDQRGA